MIVSGEQRQDSAIHRHVSIFPQTCLPSRLPHNRVEFHVYFTHFLIRFCLFNCRRSLYILNIDHSSDIWLGNSFSHSFHFLYSVIWCSKVFNLMKSSLPILYLLVFMVECSKTHCQGYRNSPKNPSKRFIGFILTFRFLILFK